MTLARALPALLFTATIAARPSTAVAQESALAALRAAPTAGEPAGALALGRALRIAGHFDEAARVLRAAAARGPLREPALLEIARVRFDQGDFRASRAACEALPASGTAAAQRHVCLARAHLVWQRAALAEREITAARAIAPSDPELLLVTADAARAAGRAAEAETAYRAAQTAMPDRAEPSLGLALLAEVAQHRDEALAQLRRAVEAAPADPRAALALGRFLLQRRGDHAAAMPLLERAARDRPAWPEALVALGDARLAAGALPEALAAFTQASQLRATEPGAQAGLGRARLRSNALAEAEAPLRLALQQVPNDADARVALAEVLARTNRGEESLEEWNHAIELLPGDPSPRLHAAEQAHAMGQNSLARAYVDRVLADDAQLAPALALRADLAFEENDRDHARTLYAAALGGHGAVDRARVQSRLTEIDAPQRHRRH